MLDLGYSIESIKSIPYLSQCGKWITKLRMNESSDSEFYITETKPNNFYYIYILCDCLHYRINIYGSMYTDKTIKLFIDPSGSVLAQLIGEYGELFYNDTVKFKLYLSSLFDYISDNYF